MKTLWYFLISIVLSGCFGVSTPDKDHYLTKNFLGKIYCTKTPLFVWKLKEESTRHFEYYKYMIEPPIKGNHSLDKHKSLSKEINGFDQDWGYLKRGSKLIIEKIIYYHKFIYGNSGYYILARINNEQFKDGLISLGPLLNNVVPQKSSANETKINLQFVSEC